MACSRFLELAHLCGADNNPDPHANTFLKWLAQKSVIDEVTQNTTEEIRAAADLCLARGVNQLTLVTSPFHIPRAAKEADIVIRSDTKYKSLLGNILLLPSETSLQGVAPNDEVTIFERPHRGDTPKPPEELMPHKIARRTFKLYKDQARLETYLREWGDLFTKHGV